MCTRNSTACLHAQEESVPRPNAPNARTGGQPIMFQGRTGNGATGQRSNRMKAKLAINGLKMIGPLIPMWVDLRPEPPDPVAKICRLLADLQVNIAFMTSGDLPAGAAAMCCIDSGDLPVAAAAVRGDAELAAHVRFGRPVGLLSIYPHQARLEALGASLSALAEAAIAVHGWASSIAAITFVIDYARLDEGAAKLTDCMALPPNPAAFRPEFKVRQDRRVC